MGVREYKQTVLAEENDRRFQRIDNKLDAILRLLKADAAEDEAEKVTKVTKDATGKVISTQEVVTEPVKAEPAKSEKK